MSRELICQPWLTTIDWPASALERERHSVELIDAGERLVDQVWQLNKAAA